MFLYVKSRVCILLPGKDWRRGSSATSPSLLLFPSIDKSITKIDFEIPFVDMAVLPICHVLSLFLIIDFLKNFLSQSQTAWNVFGSLNIRLLLSFLFDQCVVCQFFIWKFFQNLLKISISLKSDNYIFLIIETEG